MKMRKFSKSLFITFLIFIPTLLIAKPIEISNEFNLLTSENAKSYFKPLVTTIGQSFNTNLYSGNISDGKWHFGIELGASMNFIPSSQESYDAVLPESYGTGTVETAELRNGELIRNSNSSEQPTIYGGISYPIFSSPQNLTHPDTLNKSTAFPEGKEIGLMPGIPSIQLIIRTPIHSELKFRFYSFEIEGEKTGYLGLIYNLRIDQFFNLFKTDSSKAIGINIAYNGISRTEGFELSTFAIGAYYSQNFDDIITVYGGVQFETLSGNFEAVRSGFNPEDLNDSPYEEIRNGENLKFDLESFTNYRINLGASKKFGFFEINGGFAYASQIQAHIGFSFMFGPY
jgi:hypothetical protein